MDNNFHFKKVFIVAITTVIITRLINEFIYNMDYGNFLYEIVFFVVYAITYFAYNQLAKYLKKK